jgi:aspartyl aminopeptidase
MSELGEFWADYRQDQKERRIKRLPRRTEEILALSKIGYHVERKTEYQFRVNERIDLYPIHNRWHDLQKNKRGGYKNVRQFIERVLPLQ